MLTFTFVSLLSSSECVSRESGSGGTVGELAPSLITAPCRKELLMLAGDVESNPGPYTDYVGKDLCMVLIHIPTSTYQHTNIYLLVHKQMELPSNHFMWYVRFIFI